MSNFRIPFGIDYTMKDRFCLIPNALMTKSEITGTRLWYKRIQFRQRVKFWYILPKHITVQIPMEDLIRVDLGSKKVIMGHPVTINRIIKDFKKIDIL